MDGAGEGLCWRLVLLSSVGADAHDCRGIKVQTGFYKLENCFVLTSLATTYLDSRRHGTDHAPGFVTSHTGDSEICSRVLEHSCGGFPVGGNPQSDARSFLPGVEGVLPNSDVNPIPAFRITLSYCIR